MPLEDWVSLAKVFDVVMKIVAFSLGGWWTWRVFVRNRLGYPRLKTGHSLEYRKFDEGLRLVRLVVDLENCGDVLARIVKHHATLYQLRPVSDDLKKRCREVGLVTDPKDTEGDWPAIGFLQIEAAKVEIEPKESQRINYDFVISDEVGTVAAYSYFENQVKNKKMDRLKEMFGKTQEEEPRGIGWSFSTMHDFKTDDTQIQEPPRVPQLPPQQPPSK